MTSVREELVDATGVKASKKETPEAFRQRLIEAIDELEDSDYKKLSKDTRAWLKAAISEYNESGVVPDFADDAEMVAAEDEPEEEDEDTAADESGDDADEDESDEEEDETEDESVTHTDSEVGRRGGRKVAAKKAAPKKSQVKAKARDEDEEEDQPVAKKSQAKAKNSGGAKAGGGLHHARKLLAQEPAMEVAELTKAVKKAGYNVSSHTLSTTASGFRAAVKALQEEGLLKRKLV